MFSRVEIINFVLSYVLLSCLSLFSLFFVLNRFSNSCNYPSFVRRNEFCDLHDDSSGECGHINIVFR